MQFTISALTILVAAFVATTSALPAPQVTETPTATYNGLTIYGNWTPSTVPAGKFQPLVAINDCGDSTFVDESSSGSPLISDCQVIQHNIAGGGSWTTGEDDQRTLVSYGTCAFGITVDTGYIGYVGNQDIIDLITSSIQMFSWYGLVGSKGVMPCQSGEGEVGDAETQWGLYHSK